MNKFKEKEKLAMPKHKQIVQKAVEMWRQDRIRANDPSFDIIPELCELKEEGYISSARSMLMRNKYRNYRENKDYLENIEGLRFDIQEGKRTGTCIIGSKGCGKTNLAKLLADIYMKEGCYVKVFDISQQWLTSSISKYVEVKLEHNASLNLSESIVFDLSRLYPMQAKEIIANLIGKEFLMQVNVPKEQRRTIIYFLEECQMLLPQGHLRSKEAQEILRLMSVGRNFSLGYVALTQRAALMDTSVFELSFQKYFGRCDGQNDKRKIQNYVEDRVTELERLEIGEFLYDVGSKTQKIDTPRFESKIRPMQVETYPAEKAKSRATSKNEIGVAEVFGLASAFVFVIMLLMLVAT